MTCESENQITKFSFIIYDFKTNDNINQTVQNIDNVTEPLEEQTEFLNKIKKNDEIQILFDKPIKSTEDIHFIKISSLPKNNTEFLRINTSNSNNNSLSNILINNSNFDNEVGKTHGAFHKNEKL